MGERSSSNARQLRLCAILLGSLLLHPASLLAEQVDADASAGFELEIRIDTPEQGALIGDPSGAAFVAGTTFVQRGELARFDIVFVVDRSHSTIDPSGGDVDGDGHAQHWSCEGVPALLGMMGTYLGLCREGPDSVLSAEIQAVRTLVDQLDPRTTRIGVVAFSGDSHPSTPDAEVRCPLTADYNQVQSALDDIGEEGPGGQTNFFDAVEVAATEMLRWESALDRSGATQRIILFLSDGQPTAPYEQALGPNRRLAIQAAATAARFGLRIDTYGIGPDALSDPTVLAEMARVSRGIFTPVAQPSELQSIFEQVSFLHLDALRLTNRTTRRDADYVVLNADGTFLSLLEMTPGQNTIEIYARASDGSEQTRRLQVEFQRDAAAQALPSRLHAQRTLLLQNRLLDMRSRSLAIEEQRDAELRRQLEIHMQEQQAEAERRRRVGVKPAPRTSDPGNPEGSQQ